MAQGQIKGKPTETLSITYISNTAVNSGGLANTSAHKKGGMLFYRGNLAVGAMASNTDYTIGKIEGWNASYTAVTEVPGHTLPSVTALVQIDSNGTLHVSTAQGSSSSCWFRCNLCVPSVGG